MATIKFSAFTNEAVDATNTELVGYKTTDLSQNFRYTIGQLATAISPLLSVDNIYTADGNITTGNDRVVTIDSGGTLTFAGASALGDFIIKGAHATGLIQFHTDASGYNYLDAYQLSLRCSNGATTSAFFYSTGKILFYKDCGFGGAYDTGTRINITGETDDSTKYNLKCDNLSGTELFSIRNDGVVKISGQAYTELYDTVNTTLTVDWNNSNIQELTSLTGSHTFTASNPQIGATYILTLGQTGAVTPTWTGVKWPAATAPTLSGAGKTDVITLICYDATGAGLYYGTSTLNFTT